MPLRQVATDLGVARSTLWGWLAVPPLASLPAELAAALATPAGQQWLVRLVVACHLVITLCVAGGVRLVCECLHLIGLAIVVGAFYGSECGGAGAGGAAGPGATDGARGRDATPVE